MEYQQQTAEGYSAGFWYPIQWAVVTPLGTLYYRSQDMGHKAQGEPFTFNFSIYKAKRVAAIPSHPTPIYPPSSLIWTKVA